MPVRNLMDAQFGVVGLGAAGSAALWRLADRGADAIGFEQFDVAHSRGSSHGYSRVYKSVAPQGAQESALAQRAGRLWRQLESESGESILHMTGGLSIGRHDSVLLKGLEKVSTQTGLPLERLDNRELRRRFPQHVVFDDEVAVIDRESGYIEPEKAIRAEWKLAVQHGAHIVSQEVTEVNPGVGSVTIVTSHGSYEVETAIVAAGAWQRDLLERVPLILTPRRATMSWFEPKEESFADYTGEVFPVFTHEAFGETGWGLPVFDEHGVKIGLDFTAGYVIEDPSNNKVGVEAWELERVSQFVKKALPGLCPEPERSVGCMITMTPDEEFTIGIPHAHSNLVILSACSGRGFKMSAAVGDVGADLAIYGTTRMDVTRFSPDRFSRFSTVKGDAR